MIKKILIVGLIICAFMINLACPVMAADETKVIYDGSGDVIDSSGKPVAGVTDIDFDEISYQKEDNHVTIDIEFVGNIQKTLGVFITIGLVTSENEYQILYINFGGMEEEYGSVITDGGEEEIEFTLTGFGSNKLTIKFDLIDEDEDYDSIMVYTGKIEDENEYTDIYPNILIVEVTIDGPTKGKVDEAIQFYGDAAGGTEPYEWEWHFDDDLEIDSNEQNPEFTFEEPGEYEIELYVTDNDENIGFNITTITITSSSTNGDNSGNDGDSPLILFASLIVIIVIAGIAVLVYVIRR